MSKDGPPANSFTEPRLTGYLIKQGGQGFASNWRRRYFVLDHHYLFYYKSEKDRKPVGVVCLSDYQSCHKASSKKSKFTFIIEKREHTDDLDYPVRSYYIYAENDAEMNTWIDAINMEIQPFEGTKKGPKVDIKAFDELSTTVTDGGIKLSHPTAARPKPQGRRPPRKYTPFHEEDSKEDVQSSPRAGYTRRPLSQSSVEDYHSPSTTPTKSLTPQSSEETSEKRGHHPNVPLKPKMKEQLEEKQESAIEEEPTPEPSPAKEPIQKPPAPPPSSAKPKPLTPPTEKTKMMNSSNSENAVTTTAAITTNTDQQQISSKSVQQNTVDQVADEGSKLQNRPHPKPAPPPTKPKAKRSVTDATPPQLSLDTVNSDIKNTVEEKDDSTTTSTSTTSTTSINIDDIPGKDRSPSLIEQRKFNKPAPPRKQRKNSNEIDTPSHKPKPKPRTKLNKDDSCRYSTEDTPTSLTSQESIAEMGEEGEKVVETHTTTTTAATATATTTAAINETEDQIKELDASLKDIEHFLHEVKKEEGRDKGTEVNDSDSSAPPPADGVDNPTVKKVNYENVTINVKQDGRLTLTAPTQDENVTEDQTDGQSSVPVEEEKGRGIEEEEEEDIPISVSPSKDETMPAQLQDTPTVNKPHPQDPYSPPTTPPPPPPDSVDSIYDVPKSTPSPGVALNDIDTTTIYDVPSPQGISPVIPAATTATESSSSSIYDVPKSPPQTDDNLTTPTNTQARLSLIDSDYDMPMTFGVPPSNNTSSSTLPTGQKEEEEEEETVQHLSPERDAWGYALVNKKRKTVKMTVEDTLAAQVSVPEDIASVPENLRKAKEILRLAMIVKAEVLEMRSEVENELALARRERHDSQLMKQNAAEILKMAKEVLQKVSP